MARAFFSRALIKRQCPLSFGRPHQLPLPTFCTLPPKATPANMVRESKAAPHGFISVEEFIRTRDSGKLPPLSSLFTSSSQCFRMNCFNVFNAPRRVLYFSQFRQHILDPHINYEALPYHHNANCVFFFGPLTRRRKIATRIFSNLHPARTIFTNNHNSRDWTHLPHWRHPEPRHRLHQPQQCIAEWPRCRSRES